MNSQSPSSAVVALAGRMIDADGASERAFPFSAVRHVEELIETAFVAHGVVRLVCSAACGADLLALRVAERLGVSARVVLPFVATRFLATSVVGRPGEWTVLFKQVVARADARRELIVLKGGHGDEAYRAANARIVKEATKLARKLHSERRVVAIWQGPKAKGPDLTAELVNSAETKGFRRIEIQTLSNNGDPSDET